MVKQFQFRINIDSIITIFIDYLGRMSLDARLRTHKRDFCKEEDHSKIGEREGNIKLRNL